MYMRAVTVRIVYVGIVSLGILLSAAFRDATVQAAPVVAAKPQSGAAVAKAPLPVATLATIHVTASAAGRVVTAAPQSNAAGPRLDAEETIVDARAGTALPSLRMDMPFYSFGKLLPRVGKE